MKNGVVFEGVFHTANVQAKTEAEFGVALAFARKVSLLSISLSLARAL